MQDFLHLRVFVRCLLTLLRQVGCGKAVVEHRALPPIHLQPWGRY